MKIQSLLIVLGIAFSTALSCAGCLPCGCNDPHVPADQTTITVVNWPQTTVTLHACCENTTITLAELFGPLGLGGIYGVDKDDFLHMFKISHTNPCGCESSHTLEQVDNHTSVTWSGEINCEGGGAIVAHFFNDEEVYAQLGPTPDCDSEVLISTPDVLDMTYPVEIVQDLCVGSCCAQERCCSAWIKQHVVCNNTCTGFLCHADPVCDEVSGDTCWLAWYQAECPAGVGQTGSCCDVLEINLEIERRCEDFTCVCGGGTENSIKLIYDIGGCQGTVGPEFIYE